MCVCVCVCVCRLRYSGLLSWRGLGWGVCVFICDAHQMSGVCVFICRCCVKTSWCSRNASCMGLGQGRVVFLHTSHSSQSPVCVFLCVCVCVWAVNTLSSFTCCDTCIIQHVFGCVADYFCLFTPVYWF